MTDQIFNQNTMSFEEVQQAESKKTKEVTSEVKVAAKRGRPKKEKP